MVVENSPVMYPPRNDAERTALQDFVRTAPFIYGKWQQFKRLYKQVEADPQASLDLLGEFIARLDTVPLHPETADPTLELSGVGTLNQFLVRDNMAFVLYSGRRNETRLGIFSLKNANPLKPDRLADVALADHANRIAFCGRYLLAISDATYRSQGKMTVYDVTDPANSLRQGSVVSGIFNEVACNYPFIFGMANGPSARGRNDTPIVQVVSIADPDNPRVIGTLPDVETIAGVDIANGGRTLVVAAGGRGFSWNRLPKPPTLHFIDVSDPFQAKIVGQVAVPNLMAGTTSGRYAYLVTQGRGSSSPIVKILDLRYPDRAIEVAQLSVPSMPQVSNLTVRNGQLFVSGYGGVSVVDVSDPTRPRSLAHLQTGYVTGYVTSVDADQNFLYVCGYSGIQVWALHEAGTPARVGVPPSAKTLGYMKRRARRLLRTIGKQSSERYVELAARTLLAAGESPLNPTTNWIGFDILYGAGAQWEQTSHGRGAYLAKGGPKLVRRLREDRYSDAWNARPDLAVLLLQSPASIAAQELAVRILMANRTALPAIDDSILARWLESSSALLIPIAVRCLAERFVGGASLSAHAAALLYFRVQPALRTALSNAISHRLNDKWHGDFATELMALVKPGLLPSARVTRRLFHSAKLIAKRYAERVTADHLLPMAAVLARGSNPEDARLAQTLARRARPNDLLTLNALAPLTPAQREPILIALEDAFRSQSLDTRTLYNLLQVDANEATHEFGWRILAASKTPETEIRSIWVELLSRNRETPALRSAMRSPYALTLLTRCGITNEEISSYLTSRPFLAALLSSETFGRMVDAVPVSALFSLTAGMNEASWERLRGVWLSRLRRGEGLLSFWTGMEAALQNDRNGRITARLLENAEFAETITRLGADSLESMLSIREPMLDSVLARYIAGHTDVLPGDDPILLSMATHALPGVRALGLNRVRTVGMSLPFALRLLESELPESVVAGRDFIEALPGVGEEGLEVALALCDSPVPSVRRFGREFVTAHRAGLPDNDLLTALFENPDPETQYFVAEMVQDMPAPAEIAQFEKDVLRRRNAARKAKEAIKVRQSRHNTVDTATLLEMARGAGTPRDAEWALSQLAKRALAGEQIPGFALEGVAGG